MPPPCGSGRTPTCTLLSRAWAIVRRVLGVDFYAVQLHRAHRLVPAARLVQADMAMFCLRPGTVEGVLSFYALIHVQVADHRALFPHIQD